MFVILSKRIVWCSLTLVGGYITFTVAKVPIQFAHKDEGKPNDMPSYIYLPGNIENKDPAVYKEVIPAYWKLFMLSKSKDMKIRHKAVEFMSKTLFEKWQYVAISQACNINTAVGIARSLIADPEIFLHPLKDLNEIDPQKEIYKIVKSLPDTRFDDCELHLKEKVKKEARSLFSYDYEWELEVGDPSVLFHSQQKKKKVLMFNKLCLQAVLHYSSNSYLRDLIMEKGILKTLLKLQKNHKNNLNIESLIAQILANLALEEKYRKVIFLTGWIGILSEWLKSPNLEVNLPAAKALANLDTDDVSHPIYDSGIFLLTPFERLSQKDVTADVIFVHGFLGGAFYTWRQHDSQNGNKGLHKNELYQISTSKDYTKCWPKDWLSADNPSLRMISIDFKTCITSYSPCCFQGTENDAIDKRAAQIIQKLLLANVGDKPVIWIAHSMGGLIVKKILVEANKSEDKKIHCLAKNTIGIVFYSVPHNEIDFGLMADIAAIVVQLSTEFSVLGSSILHSMHKQFKDFVSKYDIPVLSFGETKKTLIKFFEFMVVPSDIADPGYGEFQELPADHLSTCKPKSPNSPEYLKVLKFMQRLTKNLPSSHVMKTKEKENIFEVCKILSLIP